MVPDPHTPTREVLHHLRRRVERLSVKAHGGKARWVKYTVTGALLAEIERRVRPDREMMRVAKRCERMIDALASGQCLLWRINAINVLSEAARTLRHASAIEARERPDPEERLDPEGESAVAESETPND